jgi:hypothetical protein
MQSSSTIAKQYPSFLGTNGYLGSSYFYMSGTSMSAAVVSGTVALMLQANPALTPDNVKCRLMSSAHPALTSTGTLAYTIFQQGASELNAYDAVYSQAAGCANAGLNIAADLAGTQHFGGGVARWNRGSDRFTVWRHDPIQRDSLASEVVKALVSDQQGLIWIGTRDAGIDLLHPATGHIDRAFETRRALRFVGRRPNHGADTGLIGIGLRPLLYASQRLPTTPCELLPLSCVEGLGDSGT